jgi:integrase
MANSAAPATLSKRNTVWKHYINFLKITKIGVEPIEPSQLTVCLFLIYLFKRGLTYGTVKSYLFSLTSELKLRGGKDILQPFDSWFIRSTLKHYQLTLGNAQIQYRKPITVDIVKKLFLAADLSCYNTRVYITMIVIGVFGLLRIGELCSTKINGTQKFIRNMDVNCHGNVATIRLYGTKTDLDKKGITKYFGDTKRIKPNPFRLIFMLKSIKKSEVKGSDPFFALDNGKPISRTMLVAFMQQRLKILFPNIPIKEWSGISLRKGGATSAMRAGVHSEIIQNMGGWKSDAYKGYIDTTQADVTQAQIQVALSTTMLTD